MGKGQFVSDLDFRFEEPIGSISKTNSVFVSQFGYEIVYAEKIEAMGEVISTKPKFDDSKSKRERTAYISICF